VVYADLGFSTFHVRLATRPDQRAGDDAVWDRAEEALAKAAASAGLTFDVRPGEGAFYGPKLEFHLMDSRNRSWQCGTIQLDFVLPDRLDASFVSSENEHLRPAMIHHAVLGSMERFIAMLLEHHEGWLPLWLAPDQVTVATVSDASAGYGQRVMDLLDDANLKAVFDDRPERLERKIVDAREQRIPIFITVGARDQRDETVSLRLRDGTQNTFPIQAGIERLREMARTPAKARS
jgi:threonyl-tRNA synthetase